MPTAFNPRSQQRPVDLDGLPVRRPELLAPAGTWECARAAVENGADAIYFGLTRFNARLRAGNFTDADLPDLLAYLHQRGVRGYVTFNTLVFADEMAAATDLLRTVIAAGADAMIVQDVGVCRLIRQLSPDFPIHASTQMTVTSAAGVAFAQELGASLVVLARECSLDEIAKIRAAGVGTETELPLEVFVHGALCVAYSGQCLTSEALGGRSANRGECAQACRMPYDLIADGHQVPLGDQRYLLSPQDLSGLEVLPGLIRAGVSSLKIEGRLKTPEYVAGVTRAYRAAIDRTWAALTGEDPVAATLSTATRQRADLPTVDSPAERDLVGQLQHDYRYDLEMGFSRGLYTGWLGGIDNQALAHARFGTKRGVFLGQVARVEAARSGVVLRLLAPLKPGDGVVFDRGRPDEGEEGGFVHGVELGLRGESFLRFGRDDLNFQRLSPGDRLWKTSDPALTRELRATFQNEQPRHRRPLVAEVHGHLGAPLTVQFRDERGRVVSGQSTVPLVAADRQPLDAAILLAQLGRLGQTGYSLARVDFHLEGAVLLPISELNRLRRELIARLDALRAAPPRWTLVNHRGTEDTEGTQRAAGLDVAEEKLEEGIFLVPSPTPSESSSTLEPAPSVPPLCSLRLCGKSVHSPELVPVVRTEAQLAAVLRLRGSDERAGGVFSEVYLEFEDPRRYRAAVASVREFQAGVGQELGRPLSVFLLPPRLFKTGEEWILDQVAAAQPDGLLLRAHEHLRRDWGPGILRRGDFSLNVANPLAAEWFRERWQLDRLTASYDLNIKQLDALLLAAPPDWFEVTIHQHMPLFHMEHCVYCAFLTTGKDYRDCGRPCEKQDVKLRDRAGAEHPLRADAGCRNTLYNARPQTAAEWVPHLLERGVRQFRVEFLGESADEVTTTLDRYARLLHGELTGPDLWRELRLFSQLGVTRGTLDGERQVARKPVASAKRRG